MMDTNRFKLTILTEEQVPAVTSIWRDAHSKAIGIEPIHSFESQSYFLARILPEGYKVSVVVDSKTDQPVAFMASSDTEISQLYVANNVQGKGIGSFLVERAKSDSQGELSLRTFAVNKPAQQFYESHGFTARPGNSDNEEKLLDILYTWHL